jgi:DNA recombination protein RmuC
VEDRTDWLSAAQDLLARIGGESDPGALALAALGFGLVVGLAFGIALGALIASRFLGRMSARLQDAFHSLSSEALDRSSDRILDLAGERLGALAQSNADALARREEAVDALVRPIRESLSRVDEKLQRVETERQGHYASLTKHLELVATANRDLGKQTQSLAQALGTPSSRGRWGELQLRRVVELAGMLEHCDFEEQVTVTGTNAMGRPDLIVHLPGGRQIAVDAKAPLQAYLAAAEARDQETRRTQLRQHARHVRRHLDALGARAYWSQLSGSPEFVVLFLPGEPFFAEALAQDPHLIERGVERKVLLAGPTTLIALLRAVSYGWQQETMAENASAIRALGIEIFERVTTLSEHFGNLGKKLDGAVDAYNTAMGSFESRVQVSARRMAELGVGDPGTLGQPERLDRAARPPRSPSSVSSANRSESAGIP